MYECGRRHETGKPYILLAEEGESLPFDINTIRTIFYNLESAKSVRETVKVIQAFTEKHIENGFIPSTQGDSLASVSESLRRIERHVEYLVSNQSVSNNAVKAPQEIQEIIKELGPTGALNYAFASRNVELADAVLPILKSKTNHDHFVEAGLTQACAMGSRVALEYLEVEIRRLEEYSLEVQKMLFGSYISGICRSDLEKQALKEFKEMLELIRDGRHQSIVSPTDRAFFLNQYQRLLHGAGDLDSATEIGSFVLQLNPDEASYLFNQATNLKEKSDLSGAIELIDRCLAVDVDDDEDHLLAAVAIYAEAGDKIKTIEAISRLEKVSPLHAEVIKETPSVKLILKS